MDSQLTMSLSIFSPAGLSNDREWPERKWIFQTKQSANRNSRNIANTKMLILWYVVSQTYKRGVEVCGSIYGTHQVIRISLKFTNRPLPLHPVHTRVPEPQQRLHLKNVMASWNENAIDITGPLWGESNSDRWIPHLKGPEMRGFYVSFVNRSYRAVEQRAKLLWRSRDVTVMFTSPIWLHEALMFVQLSDTCTDQILHSLSHYHHCAG